MCAHSFVSFWTCVKGFGQCKTVLLFLWSFWSVWGCERFLSLKAYKQVGFFFCWIRLIAWKNHFIKTFLYYFIVFWMCITGFWSCIGSLGSFFNVVELFFRLWRVENPQPHRWVFKHLNNITKMNEHTCARIHLSRFERAWRVLVSARLFCCFCDHFEVFEVVNVFCVPKPTSKVVFCWIRLIFWEKNFNKIFLYYFITFCLISHRKVCTQPCTHTCFYRCWSAALSLEGVSSRRPPVPSPQCTFPVGRVIFVLFGTQNSSSEISLNTFQNSNRSVSISSLPVLRAGANHSSRMCSACTTTRTRPKKSSTSSLTN